MKYIIESTRTTYGTAYIEVEAENDREAVSKAGELCGDYEHKENDADYSFYIKSRS